MEKKKIAKGVLIGSLVTIMFLIGITRMLSALDVLSDQLCFGTICIISILILISILAAIITFNKGGGDGERYEYRTDRMRCSKCNDWIDISNVTRPAVLRCEKCGNPILLDIEEEDVKVQCPRCMRQQTHHIQSRPAEVPCKKCGITLVIPRKY